MHAATEPSRVTERLRANFGIGELLLAPAVLLWWSWVLISPLWSGRSVPLDSPYLLLPIFLIVGIALGRLLAPGRIGSFSPWVILAAAVAFGLFVEIYANAAAAIGIQLIALAGLVVLGDDQRARPPRHLLVAAAGLAFAGVWLVLRSNAAMLLALPMLAAVAFAVVRRTGPRRVVTATVGMLLLTLAAAVVFGLTSLTRWPAPLTASGGLSSSRHTLWRDAMTVWVEHPLQGGGVGSFFSNSSLAQSNAHLHSAHSSVLQVGSELGLIGLLLFVMLIATVLGVIVQARHAAALVAVSAWVCLGIHSVIDYLFQFPPLLLMVGLVIGWATSSRDEHLGPRIRSWQRVDAR